MKKIIILVTTILFCNLTLAQSAAIEGAWGVQQSSNDLSFDMTFSISKNSVTVTNVCSGFGTTATAQITVASFYSDKTLTILESKQDHKSNGPLSCNVGAQMDTMNYLIQGNQLIFTHAGSSDSFIFIKR